MKSAIEEMYYDKLTCDKLKSGEEYLKFFGKFCKEYEKLRNKLPKKLKPQFETVIDLRNEMEAESGLDNFKYGVETGLKIGMEIAFK